MFVWSANAHIDSITQSTFKGTVHVRSPNEMSSVGESLIPEKRHHIKRFRQFVTFKRHTHTDTQTQGLSFSDGCLKGASCGVLVKMFFSARWLHLAFFLSSCVWTDAEHMCNTGGGRGRNSLFAPSPSLSDNTCWIMWVIVCVCVCVVCTDVQSLLVTLSARNSLLHCFFCAPN